MNIKIDDNYKLTSDERNVILTKVSIGQSGKSKDKEVETNIGYYGTVRAALKDYKRITKNTSNATTIDELMQAIEKIDKKIDKVLGEI